MKKFSILFGMLLYAFAWMINSVSASPFEITFPDSSKYGYKETVDATYNYIIIEDNHSAGFSFTNASAGDYKVKTETSGGGHCYKATVNKNQESSVTFDEGAEKTFTLQSGDTLTILFEYYYGGNKTITISVPASTATPTPIPTSTPAPTSTSEIPVIMEATAVPTAYIYPEDETGQYYLTADGNKIYCSFQSYELCLYYMGKPDLCERYRR